MAVDLEILLSQIRQLPHDQRLHLLATLSDEEKTQAPSESRKALGEMAAKQGVGPIGSLDELKSRAWPESESVEDFLEFRRAERERDIARQLDSRADARPEP